MDDDDALAAVCRTAYRRARERGADIATIKAAVRAEVRLAGFAVAPDDEEMTARMDTVIVTLADRRVVQRDLWDRWTVWRIPDATWSGPIEVE